MTQIIPPGPSKEREQEVVSQLRSAPRTCIPSSFSARSETSTARVIALRVRRSRPGRDQTAPQAYLFMSS